MSNKKIKLLALIAVIAIMVSAGAYGVYVNQQGSDTNQTTEMRTITDMIGRAVEIPAEIDSVCSAYAVAIYLIYAVSGGHELTGVNSKVVQNEALQKIAFETNSPAPIGTLNNVDIEEILRLNPDVYITGGHINPVDELIEETGIPVVCVSVESPEEFVKGIQLIGKILDREKEANSIVSYYEQKMEYIANKTSDIPKLKRVYIAGPDKLRTAAGDFYQDYIVETAGGINVAGDLEGGWINVGPEQVLAWDPDAIIVVPYCSDTVEEILNYAGWDGMNATRDGHVYSVPDFIASWDFPGPESVLCAMWLADKLYEEVGFDMVFEIKDFYQKFYDYEISSEEMSHILGE